MDVAKAAKFQFCEAPIKIFQLNAKKYNKQMIKPSIILTTILTYESTHYDYNYNDLFPMMLVSLKIENLCRSCFFLHLKHVVNQ